MQRKERFDRAERVIAFGFIVNLVLMLFKLSAGYWGRSDAVFADGIESACDFFATFFTMIALKVGRKPFDEKHPYGHGRAENLSALFVSLVISATGVWILYSSAQTLLKGDFESPAMIAVLAAFITIVIKEWLYRFTVKTGEKLSSPSLLAIASDHRKDAVTSISTLAGVAGAYFGIGFMDPLAAGITSFYILFVGYKTLRESTHDLMDGSVSPELVEQIVSLAEGIEHVFHVHEIKARRSGQYFIIDLKLDMDPGMSVKESHTVATAVERAIFDRFPEVGDVMVHINPHEEEHEDLIRL